MYNPFHKPRTKSEKLSLKLGVVSLLLFIGAIFIPDKYAAIKAALMFLFGLLSFLLIPNATMTKSKKSK